MLDRADKTLSLRRQCALLGVARSVFYRPVKPANDNDAALMRWIDELFTAWPFLGSRRIAAMLRTDGNVSRRSKSSLRAPLPAIPRRDREPARTYLQATAGSTTAFSSC